MPGASAHGVWQSATGGALATLTTENSGDVPPREGGRDRGRSRHRHGRPWADDNFDAHAIAPVTTANGIWQTASDVVARDLSVTNSGTASTRRPRRRRGGGTAQGFASARKSWRRLCGRATCSAWGVWQGGQTALPPITFSTTAARSRRPGRPSRTAVRRPARPTGDIDAQRGRAGPLCGRRLAVLPTQRRHGGPPDDEQRRRHRQRYGIGDRRPGHGLRGRQHLGLRRRARESRHGVWQYADLVGAPTSDGRQLRHDRGYCEA